MKTKLTILSIALSFSSALFAGQHLPVKCIQKDNFYGLTLGYLGYEGSGHLSEGDVVEIANGILGRAYTSQQYVVTSVENLRTGTYIHLSKTQEGVLAEQYPENPIIKQGTFSTELIGMAAKNIEFSCQGDLL